MDILQNNSSSEFVTSSFATLNPHSLLHLSSPQNLKIELPRIIGSVASIPQFLSHLYSTHASTAFITTAPRKCLHRACELLQPDFSAKKRTAFHGGVDKPCRWSGCAMAVRIFDQHFHIWNIRAEYEKSATGTTSEKSPLMCL